MRTNRKLELRRELLSELATDELRTVGAGNLPEQITGGGICRGIAVVTIIVVPVSLATLCWCVGDDNQA